MLELKNIIGSCAAILSTIVLVPQVIKVAKTKETDGISMGMYIVFLFSMVLWFTYGVLIKSTEIMVVNTLRFPMAVYILYYVIINSTTK